MALKGVKNEFESVNHSGGDSLSVKGVHQSVFDELEKEHNDLADSISGFEVYFGMKKDELVEACETAGVGDELDGNPSYQELLGVLFVNYFKID